MVVDGPQSLFLKNRQIFRKLLFQVKNFTWCRQRRFLFFSFSFSFSCVLFIFISLGADAGASTTGLWGKYSSASKLEMRRSQTPKGCAARRRGMFRNFGKQLLKTNTRRLVNLSPVTSPFAPFVHVHPNFLTSCQNCGGSMLHVTVIPNWHCWMLTVIHLDHKSRDATQKDWTKKGVRLAR